MLLLLLTTAYCKFQPFSPLAKRNLLDLVQVPVGRQHGGNSAWCAVLKSNELWTAMPSTLLRAVRSQSEGKRSRLTLHVQHLGVLLAFWATAGGSVNTQ
eukprot:538510-Amphidinium_carterae.1